MTETTPTPSRTLNDGTTLPEIGFGTSRLRGAAGAESITTAIRSGYRLLDTAYNYENEGAVGAAITASKVDRDELRVTSKLPGRYQRYDKVAPAVEESLYRAGLDYFDLYLIHWPNPTQDTYVEAWQALIELRRKGLLRSIGVSNFLPEHISRLIDETGVTPSVNQIELHPRFPQNEDFDWNREQGIAVEAWGPVGQRSDLQQDPVIGEIAHELGRSPVQVMLRWHLQRGTIPLPKSSNPGRQRENLAVYDFTLSQEHLDRIATLARPDGRNNDLDPAVYEEF